MIMMGESLCQIWVKFTMIVILQVSSELDQVLDHLLQRGQSDDPEGQVVGEIIMETGKPQPCRANYAL